jgi:hypothetical protein
MYRDARLNPAEKLRVRDGVRHHVSQVIRERLTPEQLQKAGLSAESRNEQRVARRVRKGAK